MSGTENVGSGQDDLEALGRLAAHDVEAQRASRIRDACHAVLRARAGRRSGETARGARFEWRALEPALASGLAALYLLAVIQRAMFLLQG